MIACDRYFNTNRSENLSVASIMYIKSHWLFYISCCRNFLTDYILKPSIIPSIYTQQCKTEFHCRINDEPFIPTNKLQKGKFFSSSQQPGYIIHYGRLDGFWCIRKRTSDFIENNSTTVRRRFRACSKLHWSVTHTKNIQNCQISKKIPKKQRS